MSADHIDRLNAALEGRYRVERELGEGGMAAVYLARDLKHERNVALKVLKPELAAVVGAERFLAEIRTTANLQHPNILPLYDSGEADGFLYYVMPHVEGETLRERLDRDKQLPVEEAVGLAVSVAGALDFAHSHGVVHRDIKPGNILMQAGQPMVGDFGIALAVGAAGGARLTETGLSVGTPYYMSPEQATGDVAVGPATDIYALACVLYEMLTGEPPYTGSTAQAVLGRIIQGQEVSATQLRRSVPANVDAAIRRALEKLPADRFAKAHDLAVALGDPSFRHGAVAGGAAGPGATRWRRAAIGAGGLAAALAVALTWTLWGPKAPAPVSRYALAFLRGQEPLDLTSTSLALTPDGSAIVYVGPGASGGQLMVKPRDQLEARPLAGTDGARAPSVSPDGSWIAYQVGGQLRKIPFEGGVSVALSDSANGGAALPVAWLDDGTLVYIDPGWRLRRMPAEGGAADVLWTPPSGRYALFPEPLPGARAILFTVCDVSCRTFSEIWTLDLRSGEARSLALDAVMAKYAASGHLVLVRGDGSVLAAPFDPRAVETHGTAVQLVEGVKMDAGFIPDFVLSPGGTLLTRTGAAPTNDAEFVWLDREGSATPLDPGWTFDPGTGNLGWSLSPDGTRLAARIQTDAGLDIWTKELPRGPLSRLTFDPAEDRVPRWSPDGSRVTFLSPRAGNLDVWSVRADGVGEPTLLYDYERSLTQAIWTRDGQWLVLRVAGVPGVAGGRDILALHLGVDSIATPLIASEFDESAPAVSDDSRWIAYLSNETGHNEIFVRPFPDVSGGRWQVSLEGGAGPLWAHSGRELFYMTPERDLVAAQVATDATGFRVTERRVLFHLGGEYYAPAITTGMYDVANDDQRFLWARVVGTDSEQTSQVVLVQNWLEELTARVGGS